MVLTNILSYGGGHLTTLIVPLFLHDKPQKPVLQGQKTNSHKIEST